MSITPETAQAHKDDLAVLCCRLEKGSTIGAENLEDPSIFDDLIESGLLNPEGGLTIGQVLGATLTETSDSLAVLTAAIVEGFSEKVAQQKDRSESISKKAVPKQKQSVATSPQSFYKIHIGKGEDISIELPAFAGDSSSSADVHDADGEFQSAAHFEEPKVLQESIRRALTNKTFRVREVKVGDETSFDSGILTIREGLIAEALEIDPLVKKLEMDIVNPDNYNVFTNTMMDICPIATKAEGILGEGTTFELVGTVMMLTGVDENGVQISDANSSDGIMGENIAFGKPCCPDEGDIIIRIHAIIEEGRGKERPGPLAAHRAADYILEEIRQVMKKLSPDKAEESRVYEEIERPSKPRVLLVKEIMGQGAMHDNLILPTEPAGVMGGRANVDLGNLPVLLTANEVRDGGIHALTCITPDTKETTQAYWREPFLKRMAEDEDLNLIGVVFIGSPQANTEKFYVSERLGRWVETMKLDGVILTTEGFGNNHIDFASHIEKIGELGIPIVGVSFCGIQGALVVGNKYMDAMVDLSSEEGGGLSCDKLGENSVTPEAALRAVAMLKDKMSGVSVKPAIREWSADIQNENYAAAEESHDEH